MITLFHSPDTRSSRFIWLLEELQVPYELVYCTIRRASGKGAPDARNPHPEKRVPALEDDGVVVTEQAAIALYLTDRFPQSGMGIPIGSPGRAAYLTWLAFFAGEIDPAYNAKAFALKEMHPVFIRDRKRVADRVAGALERGPYLMGEHCTAVDILASAPFEWDTQLGGGHASIASWLQRLSTRPGAQRMRERDYPPAISQ